MRHNSQRAAALAVMGIGWLVARILRAVAVRSGMALNRGLEAWAAA